MSNCFRAASSDPETAKKKTPARSSQTRAMSKGNVMGTSRSFSEGGQGGSNVTLAPMNSPIMIACAHGTSSDIGGAEVNGLRAGISALRPGLDVRESYVDVQDPDLVDVMAGLPEGEAGSGGPAAAERGLSHKSRHRPGRGQPRATAWPRRRWGRTRGWRRSWTSGCGKRESPRTTPWCWPPPDRPTQPLQSASRRWQRTCGNCAATGLCRRTVRPRNLPCRTPSPRAPVPNIPGERARGGSSSLPTSWRTGFFHDQLAKAGADVVAEPLLPSDVLAEIALDRYDARRRRPHVTPGRSTFSGSAPARSTPGAGAPSCSAGGSTGVGRGGTRSRGGACRSCTEARPAGHREAFRDEIFP